MANIRKRHNGCCKYCTSGHHFSRESIKCLAWRNATLFFASLKTAGCPEALPFVGFYAGLKSDGQSEVCSTRYTGFSNDNKTTRFWRLNGATTFVRKSLAKNVLNYIFKNITWFRWHSSAILCFKTLWSKEILVCFFSNVLYSIILFSYILFPTYFFLTYFLHTF
jgi:hypothetical protein